MLAIIIPYYKLAFFEGTLQSLANQSDKRFKVYIGDDASVENPDNLLQKYQGKFDLAYHRFETNLGGTSLVKQWQRCIALSHKEEWVIILGDDDALGQTVVEEFYANLKDIGTEGINVVRFATQKIDSVGNPISTIYSHPKIENAVDFIFRGVRSSLSEYVFKKEKVVEIGFRNFPLAWFSDVLAVLEFSEFKNVYSINKAIINVRISGSSISGQQDNFDLKSNAKFDFYYYLLILKYDCFSKIERKKLFLMINKCYLDNKKDFLLFCKISQLYLNKFLIKEYFKFIHLIVRRSLN